MDPVWILYGSCMDPVWILCVSCVDPVWILCGSCVDPMWILCGSCVDPLWILCGSCVDPLWILCGSSVDQNGALGLQNGARGFQNGSKLVRNRSGWRFGGPLTPPERQADHREAALEGQGWPKWGPMDPTTSQNLPKCSKMGSKSGQKRDQIWTAQKH